MGFELSVQATHTLKSQNSLSLNFNSMKLLLLFLLLLLLLLLFSDSTLVEQLVKQKNIMKAMCLCTYFLGCHRNMQRKKTKRGCQKL